MKFLYFCKLGPSCVSLLLSPNLPLSFWPPLLKLIFLLSRSQNKFLATPMLWAEIALAHIPPSSVPLFSRLSLFSFLCAFIVIDLQLVLVGPIRFWVTTEINAKQPLNIHYTCSIIRLSLNPITSKHYSHQIILVPLIRITVLQV